MSNDYRAASRRAFLSAAAAGTVAATGTLGAHVALAAVSEPDPVFALIEAERTAWEAFSAANSIAADMDDDLRFAAHENRIEVKTGVVTTVTEYPGAPSRPLERKVRDVLCRSRADIIATYAKPCDTPWVLEVNGRRVTSTSERHGSLEEALAEFDRVAASAAPDTPPELVEANRLREEADEAAEDKLAAVLNARPTTAAGLAAMLDLFLHREKEHIDDIHLAMLGDLFDSVRVFVGLPVAELEG